MKRFRYFALATLVAFAACSDSSVTPDPGTTVVTGTISGTVTIAGTGASGITVSLSSGSTATTDGSGAYSFANVPAGAYVITISDYPADVTFSATSKAATISTAGATVSVGFAGNYITTSSISGSVSAGGKGLAGVAVALSGPSGAKSGVTDANGGYQFSGLRAGNYTITISNYPTNVSFTTTTASVTVGVGEAKQAPFVGTQEAAEVNATVVIKNVTTNGAGTTVNPTNVAGLIDVTLAIDPGTNNITQVCVLLDGVEVPNGCQTLSSAAPGQDGPMAATILEPTFTINTAAAPGGNPTYLNGSKTLSARLDLSGAKQANVTTNMSLTFNNADLIMVNMTASGTPAAATTGTMWNSGTVTATATPVMYSGGVVSKATLALRQIVAGVDGGLLAPGTLAVTDGTAPFSVTWPLTGGAGTTGNVGGVSGPIYAAVSNTVLQSGLNGPTNIVAAGSAVAQTATNYVALDNVAPAAPGVWTVGTAGNNYWTGKPFTFAGVSPGASADFAGFDAGVGGIGGGVGSVACSFHVAAAGATNATILAAPAVTDMNAVGESTTNTTYDAMMNCWDALTNGKGAAAASTRATNVNVPANSYGADLTDPTSIKYCTGAGAPTAGCGAAAPADKAVLAGVSTYELSGLDALSGPGDTYGTLTRLNPNGTTTCVFGAGTSCTPVTDGGAGFATTATQGYWNFAGSFRDLAGNAVAAASRIAIFDAVNPAVQNIVLPSLLPNGGSATFSAVATDDLDLMDFATRTIYADGTEVPYTGPQMVTGAVFGAPLIQSATIAQTVNFIRSVEYTAAGAPSGTLQAATSQRFTVRDWASNSSTAFNNFAAGTVTAGTGAAALGVTNFRFVATPNPLCVTAPTTACPTTAALTAIAGGTSGSFAAPFARVIFYKVTAAAAPYTAANPPVYVGETTTRLSTDDGTGGAWTGAGTGREWTYSGVNYTATAADIGAGVLNFIAVGVDASGDALFAVAVNVPVT